MRIIKVSATQSTNNLAKEWHLSNRNSPPVCFIAREQTSGKGQRGASWVSNAGENLTFSVLFSGSYLNFKPDFELSSGVALAILEALKELGIKNLNLKWPNDIMAGGFKIGGVLIENTLNNGRIASLIVGVGLNVNQLVFPGLPKAASLRSVSGKDFDLDEVLKKILVNIEKNLGKLGKISAGIFLPRYEEVLFRKEKASTFELPDGSFLTGIIKGITSSGLLRVQVEEGLIKTFDLKEIKLLF